MLVYIVGIYIILVIVFGIISYLSHTLHILIDDVKDFYVDVNSKYRRLMDKVETLVDTPMKLDYTEDNKDIFTEGIIDVSSVSLTPKRYIELLKAEEELTELKLKIKVIGDSNEQ